MKNRMFLGAVLFGIAALTFASAADTKWSFALTGGWAHSSAGDVNDFRFGYNDYWAQAAIKYGGEVLKEAAAIHGGPNLNGEILFRLTPKISLSLGIGFLTLSGGKSADEIHVRWGDIINVKTYASTLSAFPVTLGARWTVLEGKTLRLFAQGGIGLYFSRFHEVDLDAWDEGSGPGSGWDRFEIKGTAVGLGAQAGIGVEYGLSRNIALVLEGFGRFARVSGFNGDRRTTSYTGSDSTDRGTLYRGQRYSDWTSGWSSVIAAGDGAPSGADWKDVAKFAADFSGFAVRAGIRIGL